MNKDIIKAKELLQNGDYTCVLIKDDSVYTSLERGVKPLMEWLNNGTDLVGYSVADKVIGKAAAFLYVLLGVKSIYVPVISKPALEVLQKHNIEVFFDTLVEAIRNRTNTGYCPMEQAVMELDNPMGAPECIIKKLNELKK